VAIGTAEVRHGGRLVARVTGTTELACRQPSPDGAAIPMRPARQMRSAGSPKKGAMWPGCHTLIAGLLALVALVSPGSPRPPMVVTGR
jgi:hypothetical protein